MNFRKDITETESCAFLGVEDRSKAQVIVSNDVQFMWSIRMKISGHFCLQEGLKYQYSGGIFILNSVPR